MSTTDLEANERIARRASWEAFEFALCPHVGKVNVANTSYGADAAKDHTYTVTVEDGGATACTCPADEYQPGPCKHRLAVEKNTAVVEAASVTTSTATDGDDHYYYHICHECGLETTDSSLLREGCWACTENDR